jgi:hypothetical protein
LEAVLGCDQRDSWITGSSSCVRFCCKGRIAKSVARIVSFVGEYSAHFADEDFPRGHAIRIFKPGFSNRGEKPSRSYPLLRRDTQLSGVTSFRKRISR